MVSANTTCCHKLALVLIGKYNRPTYFANQTCPVEYTAQKRAWMDIPTWCNCFNEAFYPKVCRRACYPVLLFRDNDLRCFETFQSENIVLRLFTPNVTCWKQPCDLGVIASFKKRYKLFLLKDIVSF